MEIIWYGHAAFGLAGRNAEGETVRVVLDPYRAPDVGTYAPLDAEADIVAVSHENAKYHSYIDGVRGPNSASRPVVVDGLALLGEEQPQNLLGAEFTAVPVWENDERAEPIAMVGVAMNGVRILHMGDCGHALNADEVATCGQVDILLALAGGPPTLLLPDLARFVRELAPRIVIPMHFGNDRINLPIRPVEDFLALVEDEYLVRRFATPTVTVTPKTLPLQTEVWVLPPAR